MLEEKVRRVSDVALWQFRPAARAAVDEFIRARLYRQMAAFAAPAELIEKEKHIFYANAKLLGFACNFATYKLPDSVAP